MDNAAIRENFASSIYAVGVNSVKESVLDSLPEDLAQKHRLGDLHIHDLESFGRVYNCCTPDLYKYLSFQQFSSREEKGIIYETFEKVKLMIANLANCQAGGIGFGNFDSDIGRMLEHFSITRTNDNLSTLKETIEMFLYWINNSCTRFCREAYYVTLNIGLATEFWGRQVALILIDGFQNLPKSNTRPNIVFKVSAEVNSRPECMNYDIYRNALKCTMRRMIPTYLLMDSVMNASCARDKLNIMGCRTRVYDNINGDSQTVGRGNIAYVSVNLPRIALRSSSIDDFYEKLADMMNSCVEILKKRRERLSETAGKYLEYVISHQIWNEVSSVEDMLLQGSYSIGFIGLSETVEVLTGSKLHADHNSYEAAKSIISFMSNFVSSIRQRDHMNYSLLATPGEMLSGRFCIIDRERYPHHIQEKGFYTNSFHVEVDSGISLFDKMRLEGYFHSLCNGGSITYIEFSSSISDNDEALSDAITFAEQSGISYLGFNFPLDICNICGQEGTFDVCPECDSDNILRIRRVSGYLENAAYFTEGKKAEIKRRRANI